ncbi:MAG: hypothetical protein H6831_00320 [Planctomycetes bacterium]|nr:hypothetical protein [Planctomycetota bacterium]MCB9902830.1 hypothetical protein [Planctomycetota bacterium]
MKRKVFLGAILWTLLITVVHVSLNVGWTQLGKQVEVLTGQRRQELIVGFLPVT